MAQKCSMQTRTVEVVDWIICDRCGRYAAVSAEAQKGVSLEEGLEAAEFLRVNFVGGYVSVFGDEVRVTGDFCQYCVEELLGQWLNRKHP